MLIALASPGVASAERAFDFVESLRDLNAVQNRMAAGDAAARAAAPERLSTIERALPSMRTEAWKDARNARSAAVYLLCGGSPRALRKLFDAHAFADDAAPLLAASLVYAEGRGEAGKLLSALDAKSFPANLGGHLALVQGGTMLGADHAQAKKLFGLARLLTPGSLVEEAALRRETMILDAPAESGRLLSLATRYVSKYSASPFARSFWDGFKHVLTANALSLDPARLVELEKLAEHPSSTIALEIHFSIARKAILHARLDVAKAEIASAERLADKPSDKSRALWHQSLVKTMTGDFAKGLDELQQRDANTLSPADAELQGIVTGVTTRIRDDAREAPSSPADAGERSGQAADGAALDERPIVEVVRQGLALADELLKKASRQ